MNSSNYFFDDGTSRKFWSCALRGKKQTIRHGRIGTKGRETTKTFPSASAAKASTTKSVNQKIGKGYIQVDPGKLKITRPKGKRAATKAQVAKLEKQLMAKLPDEYREFLLTQNGGQPDPDHVSIPVLSPHVSVPVGFIYGLYSKPEPFESLLFAVEQILPCLPEGHLPVCGLFNLYYYSISLLKNPGCVYYWNEDAGGYDVGEHGPIFDNSHAILVAGSFNEFLTRIALYKEPNENEEPASAITQTDNQAAPKKKTARSQSKSSSRKTSKSRDKSRLSKRRQEEILRLTYEGGDELTEAMELGEKATAKFLRKINREITDFLRTTENKYELHFFAENWHWEANTRPMLELVKNPHIDAGTLLQLYWYGCPEDYYLFHSSESEIEWDFDRYVFRILRQIERRFVKAEYKTASIPFDPSNRISMWDRRDEFARQIPDVMYQPISGNVVVGGYLN